MNRYLRFTGVSMLLLVSVLGVTFTTFSSGPALAYALTLPTNGLVVIAVDATKKGCTDTFEANINTTHPGITQLPCPEGTVITTELVPLDQATQMHVPYVVPASSNTSLSAKQATDREIQNMMHETSQTLLERANSASHPLTGCGNSGEVGVNWSPDGTGSYSSTMLFYKTIDCNHVSIDTARIYVNSNTYCSYRWDHDQYASGYFGVPNPPTLTAGHPYSHSINLLYGSGYYYENWVIRNAVSGCPPPDETYVNIGPVN